jgi:hypothetical protein
MKNYALGAVLLFAFTAPGLATSTTTTTTTTTGGGSSSETFYLVRDPETKTCKVVTERPTSSSVTVVGDTVFHTRTEAEGAIKTTKICTSS